MPDDPTKVLLVEDGDHLFVVSAIIQEYARFKIEEDTYAVAIQKLGNVNKVLDYEEVSVRWQAPELERLGLIVDDDDSAKGRIDSVKELAEKLGLTWEYSGRGGVNLKSEDGKRFGAWVMPNNSAKGMVETFCMGMIDKKNDQSWKYAKQAMIIARKKGATWKNTHAHRCRLYTWLAWQYKPGALMGLAIQRGTLSKKNANTERFVDWFCDLYDVPKR